MKKLVALAAMAALLAGCAGLFQWSPAAQTDINKLKADLQPLIADVDKAVKFIQTDYPFLEALAEGTLMVAGVPPATTLALMEAAKPWLVAADADLAVLGEVTAATPQVTVAAVQNALNSTTTVIPSLKQTVLANPAFQAVYSAWLASSTGLKPVPLAAP